jgi:cell wall-associated NlpC family hydrolase
MQPTIKDGEAITVAPVSSHQVKRGDILLYCTGRGMIAHRVVKTGVDRERGAYFIMRGDSSVSADEPVAAGRVLGKVVSVERRGRTISLSGRRAFIRHSANLWALKIRRRIASARGQIYRWKLQL